MADTTWYSRVPKDYRENIRFRQYILKEAEYDKELQEELWIACSRDILFWVNTFLFTFDPRRRGSKLIPWITYPFQDDALKVLQEVICIEDLLIEKSRDMGATYMNLAVILHAWQFTHDFSALVSSRVEDLVDRTGDPRTLFYKLDKMLELQPPWLRPAVFRKFLHLENLETNSTIDGTPTTPEIGRGDRRSVILLDEFASVPQSHAVIAAVTQTTDCILYNSTPKGTGNAFYDKSQSGIRKLRLHWTQHPIKSIGLYYDEKGRARSPRYDKECERLNFNEMLIAQELDIDYHASGSQFFADDIISEHIQKFAIPPAYRGELDYTVDDWEPAGFQEAKQGRWLIWCNLDNKNSPPMGEYAIGADVATGSRDTSGTGASLSTLSVWHRDTGEKVAEFATTGLQPHDFGILAVAAAKWFHKAYLLWEANGPGRIFGQTILDARYSNIYHRRSVRKVANTASDVPGWWSTKETKLEVLGEYKRAMMAGELVNRSKEALEECRHYMYLTNGGVAHSKSVDTMDPSGARDNHGDRVIADALGWKAVREKVRQKKSRIEAVPEGCFEWRMKMAKIRNRAKALW